MDASLMQYDRDRPKYNPNAVDPEKIRREMEKPLSVATIRRITIGFEHELTQGQRAFTSGNPLRY